MYTRSVTKMQKTARRRQVQGLASLIRAEQWPGASPINVCIGFTASSSVSFPAPPSVARISFECEASYGSSTGGSGGTAALSSSAASSRVNAELPISIHGGGESMTRPAKTPPRFCPPTENDNYRRLTGRPATTSAVRTHDHISAMLMMLTLLVMQQTLLLASASTASGSTASALGSTSALKADASGHQHQLPTEDVHDPNFEQYSTNAVTETSSNFSLSKCVQTGSFSFGQCIQIESWVDATRHQLQHTDADAAAYDALDTQRHHRRRLADVTVYSTITSGKCTDTHPWTLVPTIQDCEAGAEYAGWTAAGTAVAGSDDSASMVRVLKILTSPNSFHFSCTCFYNEL